MGYTKGFPRRRSVLQQWRVRPEATGNLTLENGDEILRPFVRESEHLRRFRYGSHVRITNRASPSQGRRVAIENDRLGMVLYLNEALGRVYFMTATGRLTWRLSRNLEDVSLEEHLPCEEVKKMVKKCHEILQARSRAMNDRGNGGFSSTRS